MGNVKGLQLYLEMAMKVIGRKIQGQFRKLDQDPKRYESLFNCFRINYTIANSQKKKNNHNQTGKLNK